MISRKYGKLIMSNLGGTTFTFVYANRNRIDNTTENIRMSKRDSYVSSKDDESPPEYNSITDIVAYNVDNE